MDALKPENKSSYMYRPKGVYVDGKPLHKRIGTRLEQINKFIFLRLIGKLLRVHPLHRKLDLSEVSSVLFIRYDAFGDMIVTTPLWRILKRLKPSIKIGVAGSIRNLGILQADTDVDVLYDYSASSLKDFFRITAKTRKEKWDLVIMCKFNQKTRGGIISRLSTKNGYNVTVGTNNAIGHQALFSRLIPLPKPQHEMQMTEQLQHLLRSVIELPDGGAERPSVMIDAQKEIISKKKIDAILLKNSCTEYIVINTDAPEVRKWGIEKNIALAQFIEHEFPAYSIIFVSMPGTRSVIEQAFSDTRLLRTHYFPTDDIQYLFSIIRYSLLVITPDTGIAHLASAESKPTLGFYPEKSEWLPYKIPAYIILPKYGELISSIPVEAAENGIRSLISELRSGTLLLTRIVYCDASSEMEIRK